MTISKRLVIILASSLAALIVVATIIVVVVVNGLNSSVREADYRACLDRAGIQETADAGEMTRMAERCHSAIYGD